MRIYARRVVGLILAAMAVMFVLNLALHRKGLDQDELVLHRAWVGGEIGPPAEKKSVNFHQQDAFNRRVESLDDRLAKYRLGDYQEENYAGGNTDDKNRISARDKSLIFENPNNPLQQPNQQQQHQQQQQQQPSEVKIHNMQFNRYTESRYPSNVNLVQYIESSSNHSQLDKASHNLWKAYKRVRDQKTTPIDGKAPPPEVYIDRILAQMRFVPKSYPGNEAAPLKSIYVPSGVSNDVPLGRDKFIQDKCPVTACNITVDIAHEQTAELRLLQADISFENYNVHKPPGQIWVLWILESPENTIEYVKSENFVNWTASYRWDSTIVTPYAKYVPYNRLKQKDLQDNPVVDHQNINYSAGKTKMVAWFVSNCGAVNDRMEYAKELGKYVGVDIYGNCGNYFCARGNSNCSTLLNERYRFYLSFENSNCRHYITEKLFENALQHNIVPIVMGGRKQDYIHAAPPHSFIHVDDFPSPQHLARYLTHLASSDEEYNEFFKWKTQGTFINTKFWCRLCALLHDNNKPNVWYRNFQQWWKEDKGTCVSGRWTDVN